LPFFKLKPNARWKKLPAVNMQKAGFSPYWILFSIILLMLGPGQSKVSADLHKNDDKIVAVKTAWSVSRAHPGDSVVLAITVDIKKGYHINADARQASRFDDFTPSPTAVRILEVPEGLTSETPIFPPAQPVKADYVSGNLMSFEGQTIIFVPMKLDNHIKPDTVGLKFMLEYQACAADYCLFPQQVILEEKLSVVKPEVSVSKINQALFASYARQMTVGRPQPVQFDLFGRAFSVDVSSGLGLLLMLLTAALGGMLLNLTPCVLPLIPIKIISLSHAAGNRKRCFALGFAMFLGILVFWLALGAMIALVNGFNATNQLFHYPIFTIFIGVIIAVMAAGMFGSFSVRLPNFVYSIQPQQDTLHGSFGLGILAAILSTPCTAPFMGAAAAWAAFQKPLITLSTFAAIGSGMALPFLVLSASPALVAKMPKTGPAGELVKEIMGLFMLAAAAYFIGVGVSSIFSVPAAAPSKLYWWPVAGFCAAAGGWLIYRIIGVTSGRQVKILAIGSGILLIALSALGGVRLTDKGPIDWVYYTPQRFERAIEAHKVVVMDFTAEWCLNCKALEESVLSNPKIVDLFAQDEVVPIKVDITGNNPQGKAKLKEVGSLTIPLLVVYSAGGKQVFKSDFYSVEQVKKAVEDALQ
jgi:thiol:disulfide interchange protein